MTLSVDLTLTDLQALSTYLFEFVDRSGDAFASREGPLIYPENM